MDRLPFVNYRCPRCGRMIGRNPCGKCENPPILAWGDLVPFTAERMRLADGR